MERLTFEGNFCDIAQCSELPCPYGGNCTQKQVWTRLKEYEDAGLSPAACAQARRIEDRLNKGGSSIKIMVELMAAYDEGRIQMLPCPIGATVWRLEYVDKGEGSVPRFPVEPVEVQFKLFMLSEWGETVFLTREEAEEALRRAEDGLSSTF